MQHITRANLDIDLHQLLDATTANTIYQQLEKEVVWSKPITNGRRVNQTYGNAGLVYEINFRGKIVRRHTTLWTPTILHLRALVSNITKEEYNFCVVQRYPNGNVGINPHKDKEMVLGTTIAGISLGATRVLTMSNYHESISIPLPSGSLYVLKPPTNTYWSHSIEKDSTILQPRISLTFRNVP